MDADTSVVVPERSDQWISTQQSHCGRPAADANAGAISGSATSSGASHLRKRSAHLSLVLISAAALSGISGCGNLESSGRNSRDVYANMEACKADWGTPGDCEAIDPKRSATGTSSFYGPRYYSRSGASGFSSMSRPGSRSSGTVSSAPSRGGFGASSAHHSGGSSHSSGG